MFSVCAQEGCPLTAVGAYPFLLLKELNTLKMSSINHASRGDVEMRDEN